MVDEVGQRDYYREARNIMAYSLVTGIAPSERDLAVLAEAGGFDESADKGLYWDATRNELSDFHGEALAAKVVESESDDEEQFHLAVDHVDLVGSGARRTPFRLTQETWRRVVEDIGAEVYGQFVRGAIRERCRLGEAARVAYSGDVQMERDVHDRVPDMTIRDESAGAREVRGAQMHNLKVLTEITTMTDAEIMELIKPL
jgi:hypothetical protein